MVAHRWCALLLLLALLAGCGTTSPELPSDGEDGRAEPVPPPETDTLPVWIHLTNDRFGDPCTEVFPVPREVPLGDPLTGALDALLAGPTVEEQAQGYGGWFSQDTAGMLRSVDVVSGTVLVDLGDLRPVIPNASTSCGSAALLAQLNRTVLGVAEGVAPPVLYHLEGDLEAFYEWLQLGPPGSGAEEADAAPLQP